MSEDEGQLNDLTVRAAQPGPERVAGGPGWKMLVGIGAVLVVAVASFSLGRATPASDPYRQDASAAPADQLVDEVTETLPEISPAAVSIPVAIKGAQVLQELAFADSSAFIVCRRAESGGGAILISVAHVTRSQDPSARPEILTLDEIGTVASCDACTIEVAQVSAEPLVLGTCGDSSVLSGMPPERARNSRWAFVVAEPGNELQSAMAMRIHCGETSIVVDGDEVVVTGQLTPGANLIRPIELPPLRFARRDNFFQVDDPGALAHFCSVSEYGQLQGSPWRGSNQYSELAYLQRDSHLGKIGFHGPVLVAITGPQCAKLFRARLAAHEEAEPPDSPPLAVAVGWPAPQGFDDWFLTCQVSR